MGPASPVDLFGVPTSSFFFAAEPGSCGRGAGHPPCAMFFLFLVQLFEDVGGIDGRSGLSSGVFGGDRFC